MNRSRPLHTFPSSQGVVLSSSLSAEVYPDSGFRDKLEFTGALVGCAAGITAIFAVLPGDAHGALAYGFLIMLGILCLGPLLVLVSWQQRRRTARVKDALEQQGLTVRDQPTGQERQEALDQLRSLALLRNVPDDVEWIARGTLSGREVTILRHTHIDGVGKQRFERTSIVVALRITDERPGVWLTRTNTATYLRDIHAGFQQDLQIGDALFDREFRIQALSPSDATRILTDPVRQYIRTGPPKESWTIGWGYVVCVFGANTTAESLAVMIRRTQSLISHLQTNPV